MNVEFYINNRIKLYSNIKNGECIILFSGNAPRRTADAYYRFFANRNFVYLTGLDREEYIFLAIKKENCIEEMIFILKPDQEVEKWTGKRLAGETVSEISGIEKVLFVDSFDKTFNNYVLQGEINTLWLDFDKYDFEKKQSIVYDYVSEINKKYPYIGIKNIYNIICNMRVFKTPEEILNIKEAMSITRDAIHKMMSNACSGMYEYEIEAIFNNVLMGHGIREAAFPSIISTGSNNFYLHYDEPYGKSQKNDIVLVDVGAIKNNYCVDISRAFPISGKFTDKQRLIYEIALHSNKETMNILKPGISFDDISNIAKEKVKEGLIDVGLIKNESELAKYYWHGVAHYVGLDVHDVGNYNQSVAENMVFTVDVGVYVREWNIGLRIEDNILITQDGYENLSQDIVREIDDVENICNM